MIGESHRAFVRAVVAAAKANGFSRVTIRFGSSFTYDVGARWEAEQDGGRIKLSAEQAETLDP